jgi:hypothetical protein
MSDNQAAEGSTYIDLDQPGGEASTYIEIDQPPATGEIGDIDYSVAHAAQVAAEDVPIEHDHVGDALAAAAVGAPAVGAKALAEAGEVTAAEAFQAVTAAEDHHAVEEAAATLVEHAVELDTSTPEGAQPADGGEPADAGLPAGAPNQSTYLGEIDEAAVREPDEVEERTDQPIDQQVDPDLESPTYDDGSESPGSVLQY